MAETANQFLDRLLARLLDQAKARAIPDIPSSTLRRALQTRRDGVGRGRLYIPHFWALYVHDGRGPFSMPPGRFMVWFRNPSDDPRLAGGYPVRANKVRRLRLRQGEFYRLMREGKIVVAAEIRKATPAANFFSNQHTMRAFTQGDARRTIPREFSQYVRTELRDLGVR